MFCRIESHRFIDIDPEFIYVPASRVREIAARTGANPFDIAGAELGHVGELCSFDAFLRKYGLGTPALRRLAAIVGGADTSRLDLMPECAGLHAISVGLARTYANDLELLHQGMVVYEALYAWCETQPALRCSES